MMLLGMGWHKPDNFAGSSSWAITIGLFVASGGLLFGYDLGVINGILAMAVFKDHFSTNQSCKDDQGHIDLCPEDSSLIVAILSGGAVIGALVAAPSGDSIGRRKTLLAAVTTFCIGAIFQICARATPMLLVGRLLAGVAVGAISVLVPLYQSETAPKWIRGTIICMYQFSITVGILTATTINVGTSNIDSGAAYRIPLGIQLVPGLILACGIVYLPETPRFLVKKGRLLEAEVSLSRFRRLDKTHPALVDELQEIIANHQYELTLGLDTYKALFARNSSLGRRTMTGCGLQMLQQLTGINFVMYYGTTFFSNAGVNKPFLTNLAMIIINCVCTVPGLIVIESWGRRKLLMAGALGMGISQLLIAAVYSATQDKMEKSHGGAANMVLVVFCALNIFPLKVRAKAMSVSTTANWLLNFGVAYAPPYILGRGANAFGLKIFFIWGSCCLLSIAFVWLMVYETSKMTLEQIDEMYERVRHAWESPGFNPTWSFQQMQNAGWAANEQPEQQAGDGHSASNVNSTDDESHETAPIRPDNSHGSTTPMVNLDFSY
ncbi:probable RCO3 glucose transporter [Fusarium fujikuroi IMI 58289]|uniref:Probable RCO3 glucose transporter n=1 Tax=Gibberella fujikuroi (strain CBS 195.34 / IMI 58289 / NRRL A-6831) TaxID=1279085 RepID=S0EHK8_GIBF5|nr:probable RCO3 glucose transporter [Fusarium fujikuroi IMI 58289]CCT74274.1 probable RCO3 glucose transporter [Fusarium fujikuroi IMI 58289]SCO26340.1 probable RCO3 glucose transporter [Fusarium fujikuroi]SCO58431.1 probable RCO3 glucose transporter [Fusarium fujikuroi]